MLMGKVQSTCQNLCLIGQVETGSVIECHPAEIVIRMAVHPDQFRLLLALAR